MPRRDKAEPVRALARLRAMTKTAKLTRMILPGHECPFGLRAKAMLEEAGYAVEEHILRSRAEVDEYLAELGVDTTPQVFIDGKRVGGSHDLQRFLGDRAPA